MVGAGAGSGADAGAAARGPGLRRAVARFPRDTGGGDRLRRVRLFALRLRRLGSRAAAAADELHARRGAGRAAARAGCGGGAPRGADRAFRWRVDRRDPCRRGARSARVRAGADRRALLRRGHQHRQHPRDQGRPTTRAICARGWRGIIATWIWRSVAGTTPGSIRGFRAFDITEQVARIQVPVLALQGATTRMAPTEQLRVLERAAEMPGGDAADRRRPPFAASGSERQATLEAIVPFVRECADGSGRCMHRLPDRSRPLSPLAACVRWSGCDTDHGRRSGRRPVRGLRAEAELLRSRRRYRARRCGAAPALRASRGALRGAAFRQGRRVLRRRQHPHARPRPARPQGELLQVHQRDAPGDRGCQRQFRPALAGRGQRQLPPAAATSWRWPPSTSC